jgi:indole-3-glycerol phosphate synthase
VVLERILRSVEAAVAARKARCPLEEVERAALAAPAPRGFARALASARGGLGLVAELKKASPSAGLLRADFDVGSLAVALASGGADALSVLTEREHFQGDLANLELAAPAGLPRLQKDFLLEAYQVFEGRAAGADAVLLIAEALDPRRGESLCRLALELGMDVLYEAHGRDEVRRVARVAERHPDRIAVGINNRDLRTFAVSLDTSLAALRELRGDLLVVSESGIRDAADVLRLRDAGARGILVGESLMRTADVSAAVRSLLASVRKQGGRREGRERQDAGQGGRPGDSGTTPRA